jgi:hypothetical protein
MGMSFATERTCALCFGAFTGKGRATYCDECRPKARQARQKTYDANRPSNRPRSGKRRPTVPCAGPSCTNLVIGTAYHGPAYCGPLCKALARQLRRGRQAPVREKKMCAPETRAKLSAAAKAAHARPEVKAKLSAAMKAAHARPEVKAKHGAAMRAAYARPEVRERQSKAAVETFKNPETRKRLAASISATLNDPIVKARQQEAAQAAMNDPAVREMQQTRNRFTPQEVEQICGWWKAGLHLSEIAERMTTGRGPNGTRRLNRIRTVLRRHGLYQKPSELP